MGVSLAKYGLHGYSTLCHVQAAEQFARSSSASSRQSGAGGAAAQAADQWLLAAEALFRLRAPERAAGLLQRAADIASWRQDIPVMVLTARSDHGDEDARRRLMDMAFLQDNPHALAQVGRLYLDQGASQDALGCLQRAADMGASGFSLQVDLGEALLACGKAPEAVQRARLAWRRAYTLEDKRTCAALLRAAGERAPTEARLLWDHARTDYAATAWALAAYIVFLTSPWLTRRVIRPTGSAEESAVPAGHGD